ncbi:hypothetical protein DMZ43_02445 [Meridianimaribacter sp. CL38]|uniref:Arm DNA-binding domain-containing protein n=1 Tax=Meridianimaribacter sp. CL38 TaxID=2213021 RepID=UPI00103AB115|nr:Arm DNA-binding domain-containing protein [Meridianimaribacter sp. CL38]TBV27923.1 hypothetical protein DMZ43_02445 [Meridianimaribacter sp. CL38]
MTNTIKLTSGTVKYRLKEPSSNKETSIILDYSFGRSNRIKFSTGYKVNPKHWDKSNQRIRAVSTIKNREKVNNDLLLFSSEFMKTVSELQESEKNDKSVLKAILRDVIRGEKEVNVEISSFFNMLMILFQEKKANQKILIM